MRIFYGLLLLIILSPIAWNVLGSVRLDDVDWDYTARIQAGRFKDKALNRQGIELVKEWVETRTAPIWQPFNIVRQQLWYNAVTEGYELELWLEPKAFSPSRHEYALYQSGHELFYRIEFDGRNRVLRAEFTATELEKALEPFVIDRDP